MAKKPISTDKKDEASKLSPKGSEPNSMKKTSKTENKASEVVEDVVTEDELETPRGSSFVTRALSVLGMLFIGGAAALYLAPKVAPQMPASIAGFLDSSQSVKSAEMEAVRSDLNARLEKVENARPTDISEPINELRNEFENKLNGLRDQVSAVDGTDIETRLSQVEVQISGLQTTLNEISSSFSNLESSGEMSSKAAAQLLTYQSTIEGLKAELETLTTKQGAISQQIDEVSANTDRRVEEAETKVEEVTVSADKEISRAELQTAISSFKAAIENGSDLNVELVGLQARGIAVSGAIASSSKTGVESLANLKSSFTSAAHAGLRIAAKEEAGNGVTSKFAAFLKSQVTVRTLEPKKGDDADAVLSRMQGNLNQDNLVGAMSEAEGLSDGVKAAMVDWLNMAKTRISVITDLDALVSE